jgi:hypothetical protein
MVGTSDDPVRPFEWAGGQPGFKTVHTKKAEELFWQSMQTKICLPSLERLIIFCPQLFWVIVFSSPFYFQEMSANPFVLLML